MFLIVMCNFCAKNVAKNHNFSHRMDSSRVNFQFSAAQKMLNQLIFTLKCDFLLLGFFDRKNRFEKF